MHSPILLHVFRTTIRRIITEDCPLGVGREEGGNDQGQDELHVAIREHK